MDQYNINKVEIIDVKIDKLEASKKMIESLLNEYLINDPDYPSHLLTNQIDDINLKIKALLNLRNMI